MRNIENPIKNKYLSTPKSGYLRLMENDHSFTNIIFVNFLDLHRL